MPISRLQSTLAAMAAAVVLPLAAAPSADAASVSTWDKVAKCESSGDWSYYRAGWPYYGGLQFSKSTWDAFGGRQYAEYPYQATKEQQIRIGEKVLATQGEGAWPTCGPPAGLGDDHADPYPAEPPAPQSAMAHITPVKDLTGDGVPDIVTVEKTTGDLYRYSGPDYGGSTRVRIGYGWNGMSEIVGVGDITGDGVADILAVDAETGNLYRYSGPDYGGRSARVQIGSGWDSMTSLAGVGDITGDGVPDLVAVEKSTGDLYRYSGPDYAGRTGRVQIGTGWNSMTNLAGVGDITGDGVPDLVAVEKSTGDLYRYSGPDYAGRTGRVQIGTGWNSMTNLAGVGDITGDGVPDLVAVKTAARYLYRYSGPSFPGSSAVKIGTDW
ncbi:ATP/GTP-binding protein [Streptomyces sp. GMY01]|nr:ATP/GTP-binding protein [Streptomyces sp. GMY02]